MDQDNIPEPWQTLMPSEPPATVRSSSAGRPRPSSRPRPPNDDDQQKKNVMVPPASKPGFMAVSGSDAPTNVGGAVESDAMIKQRAALDRASPARKPGVSAVVHTPQPQPASKGVESDAMIKQRAALDRASPASKPGVSSVVHAPQPHVESDAMMKQRVALDRASPASKPGASSVVHAPQPAAGESDAMIKQRAALDRASPVSKPGVSSVVRAPQPAAGESDAMIKQRAALDRASPVSKPGVSSVVHTPQPAAGESDAMIKQRAALDRASPSSKPGASAVVRAPQPHVESDAMIKQRASAGRPPAPASRPGASAYVHAPMDLSMEADEPGAIVTTATSRPVVAEPGAAVGTTRATNGMSSSNDDKKARVVPASKPGAVSMSTDDEAATVQAVESDMLIKQREKAAMKRPAGKPGVVAVAGMEAAQAQAVIAGKEQDELDLLAKQRAKPDPSGHSLTSSGKAAVAKSQTTESDLMIKQRVARPPASRPGVEHSLTTEDSLAVMQAVDSDIAIKQRVARERASGVQASSLTTEDSMAVVNAVDSDMAIKKRAASQRASGTQPRVSFSMEDSAAVVQSVDSDMAIKQRAASQRVSGGQGSSLTTEDAEALVASHDADMASKQNLKSSFGGSAGPVASQDFGPPSSKSREQMEATMERMEMDQEISQEKSASTLGRSFSPDPIAINTFSIGDDADDEFASNPSGKFLDVESSKFYMDESGGQEEGDRKDLIEATQIDEDAEREKMQGAEAFVPEGHGRYRLLKRPGVIAFLLGVVCVCIAAIVSGAVVASFNDDGGGGPTEELVSYPTASPTLAPTSSDEQFLRDYLVSLNISKATLDQAPVAYDMAARWYADVDPGRDRSIEGSKYPWDLTRFVMAWFYYAASSNGTQPWTSCNPPDYSKGEDDTCTWLQFSSPSFDRSYIEYTQVPGTPRWLSAYDTSAWAGLQSFGAVFDPNDPNNAENAQVCNSQLHVVELLGYGLSGPLPYMLNLLPCMVVLNIGWSPDLTGTLDEEFFNFGTTYFFFSSFQLVNTSRVSGTIPEAMWALPALGQVIIGDTNITGTIPDLIYPERVPSITELQIFGHQFNNSALPVVRDYPGLSSIRFHRNNFKGQIPSDYGNLPALSELWLFQNLLTGPVPETFLNAANMAIFRIFQNQLSGTFPNVLWSAATEIHIESNRFEGPLPANLVNMTTLQAFQCYGNNFNGTLDPDIGNNLLSLQILQVHENDLSGSIPDSLANLQSLQVLSTELNNFSGDIPFDICRLRSVDGLDVLSSDCLGYPPQNYCFCCTSCCSSGTGYCEITDIGIDS